MLLCCYQSEGVTAHITMATGRSIYHVIIRNEVAHYGLVLLPLTPLKRSTHAGCGHVLFVAAAINVSLLAE
jgi:hypothetical protein